MRYKTVFIDWFGTLSNSRFWDRWASNADTYELYELVQSALFGNKEGRLLVQDWMRGYRSVANVLAYIHDMTGIPIAKLESELHYSSESMTFINSAVVDKIRALRSRGIKVVLASDNMDTFRLWTVPALGLESLFDGILVSESMGVLKTELDTNGTSSFFSSYLVQHGLQPGESVLIDDSEDTRIVESFGIDFLQVDGAKDADYYLDHLLALT